MDIISYCKFALDATCFLLYSAYIMNALEMYIVNLDQQIRICLSFIYPVTKKFLVEDIGSSYK